MKKILKTQNLGNLKILVVAALFGAISFISGKFLAFNIGDTIRLSFENLPLIMVGMLFGPTVGAVTAVTADIIGCLLRGYAINPVLTLAAAFIGFSSGLIFDNIKKENLYLRITASVVIPHLIGSVIIKTVGLCIWYHLPLAVTLFGRSINYIIVASLELFVLIVIFKNKAFVNQITKITGVK